MSSTPHDPTPSPDAAAPSPDDREELRDLARDRVEAVPAESALGHAGPAGGSDAVPQTCEGDENA